MPVNPSVQDPKASQLGYNLSSRLGRDAKQDSGHKEKNRLTCFTTPIGVWGFNKQM